MNVLRAPFLLPLLSIFAACTFAPRPRLKPTEFIEPVRSAHDEGLLADLMVATRQSTSDVSDKRMFFMGLYAGVTRKELSDLYAISSSSMERLCSRSPDGNLDICHVYVNETGLGQNLGIPFGLIRFMTSHDVKTGEAVFILVNVSFSDPTMAWNLYEHIARQWSRAGRRISMSRPTQPTTATDICSQAAKAEDSSSGSGVRINCSPDVYAVQVILAEELGARRANSSSDDARERGGGGNTYFGGKNCTRGCPCGNTCIDCSKQCHVGSGGAKRSRRRK